MTTFASGAGTAAAGAPVTTDRGPRTPVASPVAFICDRQKLAASMPKVESKGKCLVLIVPMNDSDTERVFPKANGGVGVTHENVRVFLENVAVTDGSNVYELQAFTRKRAAGEKGPLDRGSLTIQRQWTGSRSTGITL